MGKIKASALIDQFERMAREHWSYEWGAAREGCVDCSGAFVYAYKALGGPAIAHGSNTIVRKYCGPIVPASEAKPGYAVLRWREDGEPERYEDDGLDDFYHIGLMGRNGMVLNAKSTAAGFVESTLTGWAYAAPLLAVEYSADPDEAQTEGGESMAEETALYRAQVVTKNDPLTLRDSPGGVKIGKLPKGGTVDVLAESDGWMRVRYGGFVGWASGTYLNRIRDAGGSEPADESRGDAAAEAVAATMLVREDGDGVVTLIGRWRVADD